jgi:magnesium transporter
VRCVIVGIGRYCRGVEVDQAQSTLIRTFGTLTPDAVSMVTAMYRRATVDPSDFLWMALESPPRSELEVLGEALGIPMLWIDDALNPQQRAKVEFADGRNEGLIVFKIVSYDEPTSSIETGQIALLIGRSYVVTVRLGPVGALGRVRADLVSRPEFLALGPMAAVHGIMDAIVDDYLEASEEIGKDIDRMEEGVFSAAITDDSESIYLLKRENLELRRAVAPLVPVAQRLVAGDFDPVGHDLRNHFRDIGDHLLRAHDNVESSETLLMSMLQASNARQSLQQNTDMRKIAAYAAMLAVPTAIAGIYGMNFEHMPELGWRLGYPAVLTLMALSMLLMFRAFKRSGWL